MATNFTRAAFRISSRSKTATEMQKLLNLASAQCIEAGERISSDDHREAKLLLESGLSNNTPLEMHIEHILSILESKRHLLNEFFVDDYLDIRCAIGFEDCQGAFDLNSAIIRKLSEYRVDLIFSLYSSEVPDPI